MVAEAVGGVRDLLVGDELKEDFELSDMFDSVKEALASRGAAPPLADEVTGRRVRNRRTAAVAAAPASRRARRAPDT